MLYFIDSTGRNFKTSIVYQPYFLLEFNEKMCHAFELTHMLEKLYEDKGLKVSSIQKDDLSLPNHLSGIKRELLQLNFRTVSDLVEVRNSLRVRIAANKKIIMEDDRYEEGRKQDLSQRDRDPLSFITEMKEYDVPYTVRVAIDLNVRVGAWYIVRAKQGEEGCTIEWQKDRLEKCNPR